MFLALRKFNAESSTAVVSGCSKGDWLTPYSVSQTRRLINRSLFLMLMFFVALSASSAFAQSSGASGVEAEGIGGLTQLSMPALSVTPRGDGGSDYSVTIQLLLLMTALTLLPSFLLMMTSFTRIIIVFAILRQALGLQQTPSNQILLGLALFLTYSLCGPSSI